MPPTTAKKTIEKVVEEKKSNGNTEMDPATVVGNANTQTNTSPDDSGSNKRSKTSSLLEQLVSPHILSEEDELRIQYEKGKPYPHGQLQNLFRKEFITSVKDEIKSQTKVNFKESDLFRVYQSIDLANLEPNSELAKSLPHVMQLRQVLYSQEWRSFMERVSGLPPSTLNHQIDSACNCHAPGCHLLCHDDVIGTRKISYILYLTEPDWLPEDEGGALELYPPQTSDDVKPLPTARVFPTFNSMAFFVVTPGVSFHAVQEVLGDRPRLSLQGWYHAAVPPDHMDQATLQQLKTRKINNENEDDDEDMEPPTAMILEKEFDWTDEEEEQSKQQPLVAGQEDIDTNWLSKEDRQFLSKYLQFVYLTEDSLNEIQQKFEEESSVQLCNFLLDKWVPKQEVLDPESQTTSKEKPAYDDAYYTSGCSTEWKLQGPAHKQRYLQYQSSTKKEKEDGSDDDTTMDTAGSLLYQVKTQLFESRAFAKYLARITSLGKPMGVQSSQIRRFRRGLDYTVAHYGLLVDTPILDATMCFVQDGTQEEKDAWQSGDVGGFECYIEADDDEEEAEEAEEAGEIESRIGGPKEEEEAEADHSNKNTDPANEGEKSRVVAVPRKKSSGPADEYNEDDDTALLSVSASNNTLSLVYRDPGTMRFVKYVGYSAPSSRYDISLEYQVPQEEDDDDDDDENNHDNSGKDNEDEE